MNAARKNSSNEGAKDMTSKEHSFALMRLSMYRLPDKYNLSYYTDSSNYFQMSVIAYIAVCE